MSLHTLAVSAFASFTGIMVVHQFKMREHRAALAKQEEEHRVIANAQVKAWIEKLQPEMKTAGLNEREINVLKEPDQPDYHREIVKRACLLNGWHHHPLGSLLQPLKNKEARNAADRICYESIPTGVEFLAAHRIYRIQELFDDALRFKECEAPPSLDYERWQCNLTHLE